MTRYEYFDRSINVAIMAKELAQALDDEAELHGDIEKPSSQYRHARIVSRSSKNHRVSSRWMEKP